MTGTLPGVTAILIVCCIVFATVVVLTSVILLVHHAISNRRRTAARQRLEAAAAFLAPALVTGGGLVRAVEEARSRWGDGSTAAVLRRARNSLAGEAARGISNVLHDMGEVDRLVELTHAKADWERAAALTELAGCGGRRAARTLEAAASDPVPQVRRAAREGLLALREPGTVRAAVTSYLKETPQQLAWRRSFYSRLARAAPDELARLVETETLPAGEDRLALDALAMTPGERSAALAREKLDAKDPDVRASAVRLLGSSGGDDAARLLVECLEDPEWFVRASAARALTWVQHDRTAHGPLVSHLSDESSWVRANAASTLAAEKAGGKELLFEVLDSRDGHAREAASAALAILNLTEEERARLNRVTGAHEGTIVPFPAAGQEAAPC